MAGAKALANASLLPDFKPFERRNPCFNGCNRTIPVVRFSLHLRTSEAQLFAQDSLRAKAESSACFRPHVETKPRAQFNATRIHPGNSSEVADHYAPSAAGSSSRSLQRLFKPLPRFCISPPLVLGAVDQIREVTVKVVEV